jgi:hypothetical protein
MGRLNYGDGRVELVFDERTLSHLQVAMAAKLRRRESFFLSWNEPSGERTSLWIDHSIPLQFHFDDPARTPLNRAWVELLDRVGASAQGMVILPEPSAE